ncbi:CopG family transcriptional regulator [Haloplanus rallus]|uniref:CopG family transcriptional regulator n=1 Tax=Haloplanus rallus TaxID=1816183 RepID=A0A6B9F1T8_9EURY|nr:MULTISPECIES: CopG family transcriptional regulator [Haloplanus]QGX94138.1 CopG family transcriptional regulator [Haloplanus rallus]
MPSAEISLPDDVDIEIRQLVEEGEFINRDQAVEELLSLGVSAYTTDDSPNQTTDEDLFTQVVDDQQDPAIRNESDDEHTL